jgi:hypothetical protein
VWNALPPNDVIMTAPEHAAKLREEARKACAKARWRTCLDRLDEADKIDPDRALDPGVRKLREQAKEGLPHKGQTDGLPSESVPRAAP